MLEGVASSSVISNVLYLLYRLMICPFKFNKFVQRLWFMILLSSKSTVQSLPDHFETHKPEMYHAVQFDKHLLSYVQHQDILLCITALNHWPFTKSKKKNCVKSCIFCFKFGSGLIHHSKFTGTVNSVKSYHRFTLHTDLQRWFNCCTDLCLWCFNGHLAANQKSIFLGHNKRII